MCARQKYVLLTAFALILSTSALLLLKAPREPVYEEFTLREWIQLHESKTVKERDTGLIISQLASNAIPWLLFEIQARDTLFSRSRSVVFNRVPWLKQNFPVKTPRERARRALSVFASIRGSAGGAVPGLIRLVRHREAEVRANAVAALNHVGQGAIAAIPVLADALKDPDAAVARGALRALTTCGDAAFLILRTAIESPDDYIRENSIQAVAEIAPWHPEAVAMFMRALNDPVVKVREEALNGLRNAGRDAETAIPALVTALDDAEGDVRAESLGVLKEFGAKSISAMPKVRLFLNDPTLAEAAFEVLREIGPAATPLLIEAADNPHDKTRHLAVQALAGVRSGEAVPGLVKALMDDKHEIRRCAAGALDNFRDYADRFIPVLLDLLKREDPLLRACGAEGLMRLGPTARIAVPDLVERLSDMSSLVRANAAEALGSIGPDARMAFQALLSLIEETNHNVGFYAAGALGNVGGPPDQALPVVYRALKSSNPGVRTACVAALGSPLLLSRHSIPFAAEGIRDENERVRADAVQTLDALSRYEEVVPVLSEALKDESGYVRARAANALAKIGPAASAATPRLITLVLDSSLVEKEWAEHRAKFGGRFEGRTQAAGARSAAVIALEKIAADSPERFSAMLAVIGDKDRTVARQAARALITYKSRHDDLLQHLRVMLLSSDAAIRQAALEAIEELSPNAARAVSFLTMSFNDPNESVRRAALRALGSIGPEARGAAPSLLERLRDNDVEVRLWAAWALAHIDPENDAAVPMLITALKDRGVRHFAVEILAKIGPVAASAAPALRVELNTFDRKFKELLDTALRNQTR